MKGSVKSGLIYTGSKFARPMTSLQGYYSSYHLTLLEKLLETLLNVADHFVDS